MTLTTETIKQWRSDAENIARQSCVYETEYSAAEAILALTAELLANREAQPVACDIERIKRHALPAGECPRQSRVVLLSSLQRLLTSPPAPAVPDDVQRDADRWRAMLGSARIRILGAAGFGATGLPGGDPDYRHFGMEIWTHYPGWLTEKNEYGIDILTKYADICRAAMLAQPVSSGYKLPDGWIACSERMPEVGERDWRTAFPVLVKCEIGVIPAYYGFTYHEGEQCFGFMESIKFGDASGSGPEQHENRLMMHVTHWMPLPAAPEGGNG